MMNEVIVSSMQKYLFALGNFTQLIHERQHGEPKHSSFLTGALHMTGENTTAEFDGAICVAHLLLRRLCKNLKLDFL